MNNIYLLDCTLRDGGFVNDWKFGFGSIKSIFSRLDCAGIDAIEIGLIDERRQYDLDRSIFPDTNSIEPIFKKLQQPNSMVTAMIDFGTCSLNKIGPASESHIDGIRVIFKKNMQDEALEYLANIKKKGYKIFVNPVSVTSYSDNELITLIRKINKIEPVAVTVVDTYGLLHSEELLQYCKIMDENLNMEIILAYHAHNNFQLAYSNAISVMNSIKNRDLMIDGTLFGMGKSAGNACTELLAMYMNERFNKSYDINQIQEAIDIDIQKEFQRKSWGYKPLYYISALNDCHPDYVKYFIEKKSLSIKSVNKLLERIPQEAKLSFNKSLAEGIYQENQYNYFDDSSVIKELSTKFLGKKILLVGPGKTIIENKDEINSFIKKNDPTIVTINFIDDLFPIDYVFISNAKRYSQFFSKINDALEYTKLICTSNITETREKINYTVNFASLISDVEIIRDNPLILFIHLLKKIGISDVFLAGFDGYVEDIEDDYYKEYIPFLYDTNGVVERNSAIIDELNEMSKVMKITTITNSIYFS